ncbi:MAG: Coenzyme F420 hydrogenase/dehydrogenase, beta subunit C-terminal domain [Acutalibacteraceae bacterium]
MKKTDTQSESTNSISSKNTEKKHLPELYVKHENCCGCTACYSVCPMNAISMREDEEGFLYPVIEEEKCIGCNKCVNTCAFKKNEHDKGKIISVYAVKHHSEKVRMNSRSGGIFTAISDEILKNGGVVYGCIMSDQYTAVHIRSDTPDNRDKMRGSKYIQSDLGDCFKQVKSDLDVGKQVLFTGTSCQIDGLRAFLKKDNENLICIDIVCHAVPSRKIWESFVKWQELKYGKCVNTDFRNKTDFGWAEHIETLTFEKKGKQTVVDTEIFRNMFYGDFISRPSCYHCPYKSIYHPGDITIGDYWGVENAASGFSDGKGVSLVIINTEKGKTIFEAAKKSCDCVETKIEDSMQSPFLRPINEPENRNQLVLCQ